MSTSSGDRAQIKNLTLLLKDHVETAVDGGQVIKIQTLIDLIKRKVIIVATFPSGPPDGG